MTTQRQQEEKRRSGEGRPGAGERKRHRGRTLAEWTTLAVSCVVIAGMAGYLLYQETKPEDPVIVAHVRPQFEKMAQQNGTFVLPVEVRNGGGHTLRNLKVSATYTDAQGQQQSTDQTIDFLGEKAGSTVYFYFEEDPRRLGVRVKADTYSLE